MGKTLFEKIWDTHVVKTIPDGPSVLYIDRHFIHEVTSPQAFKGLSNRGAKLFRPKQVIATADHNVPTLHQELPIKEELSRIQVQTLKDNCDAFGVELYGLGHPYQGIVHVIGLNWVLHNPDKPLFAEIVIPLHMVHLVRSLLELEQVKWKWFLLRNV